MLFLFTLDSPEEKDFFEKLYLEYSNQMYVSAMQILHNETLSEDVVSDVFLKIALRHIKTLKQLPSDEDRRYYLLKATKNTAINRIKNKEHFNLDLNDSFVNSIKSPYVSDQSFIDQICIHLDYEKVLDILTNIGAPYTEVLYLRFVLDLSIKQISQLLNRKESTIKVQIKRGKELILKKIEADPGEKNVND